MRLTDIDRHTQRAASAARFRLQMIAAQRDPLADIAPGRISRLAHDVRGGRVRIVRGRPRTTRAGASLSAVRP